MLHIQCGEGSSAELNRFESSLLLGYGDLVSWPIIEEWFTTRMFLKIKWRKKSSNEEYRLHIVLVQNKFWEKCFSAKYFDLAQALPWFPSACIPESPPHFLSSGKSCGVPQYSGFVNPVAGDQEPQMCLAPCCMTILPEEFDEGEEWSKPLGRVYLLLILSVLYSATLLLLFHLGL